MKGTNHVVAVVKCVLIEEWLARGHMDGKVVIPGHPSTGGECPPDLLEQEPAPPKLNVVTLCRDLHPKVPEDLVKENVMSMCFLCVLIFSKLALSQYFVWPDWVQIDPRNPAMCHARGKGVDRVVGVRLILGAPSC